MADLLYRDGIDNCPECFCWYGSADIQWQCLDGGCDCHYEGDGTSPVSGVSNE